MGILENRCERGFIGEHMARRQYNFAPLADKETRDFFSSPLSYEGTIDQRVNGSRGCFIFPGKIMGQPRDGGERENSNEAAG